MAPRPSSDRPEHDRLTVASLTGISSRYTTRGPDGWAEGVTALRERAGGRADLLAEAAGITWGAACATEDRLYWYFQERQVLLLLDAGADLEQVHHWFQVGQERTRRPRPSI
jgi:hypothetical protein